MSFIPVSCWQLIETSLQVAAQDMKSGRYGPTMQGSDHSYPNAHNPEALTLPGIHLAHAAVQHRLQLCAQTFKLCPDIVTHLVTQYEKSPPTEMVRLENLITILLVTHVIGTVDE